METVIGVILLLAAVFLVIAVLMQSGKSHNLSGTIAGGAETFFGKTKGKTMDKMLSKVTSIVAVCFVILVIVMYVIQPNTAVDFDEWLDDYLAEGADAAETTGSVEEDAANAENDAAEAIEGGDVNGETAAE